ncbi:hypothetical protein Hanom_Chr09g00779191 [Helianthus anomalus]
MSSSESSDLSDEHDHMELVSDDEIGPVEEVFTSDTDSDPDEDPDFVSDDDALDEFHPFALPDFTDDDIPLEDGVDAIDPDLIDGEVFDVALLEVASPVVSVVDISSDSDSDSHTDSRESVTSSALQAVGLEAYLADDDAISAAPASHAPTSTPISTPPHNSVHTTSDESSHPLSPLDLPDGYDTYGLRQYHHTFTPSTRESPQDTPCTSS